MDEAIGRDPVAAPPPDPLHQKWCRWHGQIKDRISGELFFDRFTFREIQRIIADNGNLPGSHVFDFFARTFVRSQVVAVRAEVDVRDDVVTLGRLLTELRDHPEVMTRQRYVAPYPTGSQWIGDSEFTDTWAGTEGEHLDPAIVHADLDGLRSGATRLVKHYVNKEVAHHDEQGAATIPTFADLDDAIDNLGTLLTRYGTLLTGSNLAVVEPVVQYDWQAPFRQPWIKK